MRIREEVFRVNLQPSNWWAGGHHLRDVRKPKTNAGARCYEFFSHGDGRPPSICLFRSLAAAHNPFAIAFWNEDPGLRITIDF